MPRVPKQYLSIMIPPDMRAKIDQAVSEDRVTLAVAVRELIERGLIVRERARRLREL